MNEIETYYRKCYIFIDESDRDTQFGDDEEDYDLFSRLEESRAELEGQLGCDKFLKVYKTVQVKEYFH